MPKRPNAYPNEVTSFTAARSLADLDALETRIDGDAAALALLGIPVNGTMINVQTNSVEIGTTDPTDAKRQLIASMYGGGATLAQEAPTATDDAGPGPIPGRDTHYDPLEGGVAIHPDHGGFCTGAFMFIDSSHSPWMLTAGHCFRTGSGPERFDQGGDFMGYAVHATNSENSSSDAASIITTGRGISPYIHVGRGRRWKVVNVAVSENNQQFYADHQGEIVRQSGARSGYKTGKLLGTDHRALFDSRTKNLRGATYPSGSGDSGSPIFTANVNAGRTTAVGIHKGSITNYQGPLTNGKRRRVAFYSHIGHVCQELFIHPSDFYTTS